MQNARQKIICCVHGHLSNAFLATSLEQKSPSNNGRKSYKVVPKENGNYHNQATAHHAAQYIFFFANKQTNISYPMLRKLNEIIFKLQNKGDIILPTVAKCRRMWLHLVIQSDDTCLVSTIFKYQFSLFTPLIITFKY